MTLQQAVAPSSLGSETGSAPFLGARRFEDFADTIPQIIWSARPDGSADYCNKRWYDFTGVPPSLAFSETWQSLVHPEDRGRVEARWHASLSKGEDYQIEYRLRHHSGDYRWVKATAVPLRASDGSVREWIGTLTEIHDLKHAEEALRTSEERLRLAVEITSLGTWDSDLVMGSLQWSAETRDILGVSPEAPITAESFLERIHPDDRASVKGKHDVAVPGGDLSCSGTFRIIRADNGEVRWVASSSRVLLDETGKPIRTIGTIQDISAKKLSEEAIQANEERLRLALQTARMFAWEQNTQTNYVTRSEQSVGLLGIGSGPLEEFLDRLPPEEQVRQKQFLAHISARGSDAIEFQYRVPNGETLWLGSRGQRAGSNSIVGVTLDMSDRKAAEDEVWRVANHDPLTGLPNRVLFQRRLEQALAQAKQDGTNVSLLLIDLDDFKDVNDTLGHDAGDALLKEAAGRLVPTSREVDMVARLGGDEFAILVADPIKPGEGMALAETILERFRQPFSYKGRTLLCRASIGVAALPESPAVPSELMKDADIALYRAKAEGRNRAVSYAPDMRVLSEQRLAIAHEMREAISRDQIVPYYLPTFCLSSGRVVGVEALSRWEHPTRGLITPSTFGSAFDDPDLAKAMGKQLIGKIALDIRKWLNSGLNPGCVAINLSSAEFNQPDLADDILRILDLVKVPTKHFEVEVTEKVLLEGRSGSVADALEKFQRHGVQIALDDFGTGYASLTHLKQFPVDHIKIDKSFVSGLLENEGDAAIVAAVIGLGKSLNLQVTAEGIETEAQARRLRAMGCHNGQGYLYARPLAAADVASMLSDWRRRVA
jgi:diguanylate cyclase (GGDEF)-like protein/PAS domain S-box-containing protein